MKKLFVCCVLCLMSVASFAQTEVTVKAGTLVPLQVVNYTKAADVNVGQKVLFRVARDINIDGVTAIPYGTTVNGTVYEAKKSSWWGTKGRLGIKVTEMYAPNGEMIPLQNGDLYVTGKNRTALSVLLFCFLIPKALRSSPVLWMHRAGVIIERFLFQIHPSGLFLMKR